MAQSIGAFAGHLTIVHYGSPTRLQPEPIATLRLCLPFRVPPDAPPICDPLRDFVR
ncbi:hypothetical protein SBA4_4280001 [Candidatus Sulfopaludibacter sp. SbA4]|nr:hypothetical protein SBA4_4280001 [Candidatus Sulfopaludibacter sp. SbA4]